VRAGYDSGNGLFSFTSYRDPCVKETLDAFEGVFHHIANEMDLSPPAVEQAIIGSLKALDQPIRPGQAVGVALSRHIRGDTPELRKSFRKRLLALKGEDIRRTGTELLAPAFRTAPTCVLSSRERLTAANTTLDGKLSIEDL
jgi:Zn-dependent M16 (insulinase) family peptidase